MFFLAELLPNLFFLINSKIIYFPELAESIFPGLFIFVSSIKNIPGFIEFSILSKLVNFDESPAAFTPTNFNSVSLFLFLTLFLFKALLFLFTLFTMVSTDPHCSKGENVENCSGEEGVELAWNCLKNVCKDR